MKRVNKSEFTLLFLWPVIAAMLSLAFNAEIYFSMFLFLIVPSIYLSRKHPHLIRKTTVFSLAMSIPIAFLFDYIMESTEAWALGRMAFPHFWIIEYVSLLQIIWLFFYAYLVIMYYEVFFDKSVSKLTYPRTKWFFILMILILAFVVFSHIFYPLLLNINYFYLKGGIILGLLPLAVFFFEFPALISKFIKIGLFFAYYTLVYELTALSLHQWYFPNENQFLFYVNIFGHRFPFEELFFWIFIGAVWGLVYYEFFDDDGK